MKPSKAINFIQFCLETKRGVLLVGKGGIGKTDIIKQAVALADARDRAINAINLKGGKISADEVGWDLIISHPVVADPTDYKGLPMPNADRTSADFLPFGDLQKLMNAKRKTVFFVDDLGQASPMVQASLMQLLWGGEINGKKISDKVVFMGATNRKQDNAGVVGILEPVKSRWDAIIDLETDANDWVMWALDNNVPMELVTFVRMKPDFVNEGVPSKDIANSPRPRTLFKAGKFMTDSLPEEFEFDAFKGACGEAFAVEFCAFLQVYRNIPSLEEIYNNPTKVDIPKKADLQYALCGALVNVADDVKLPNIIKFLERLPVEFQMFVNKDLACRKPKLTKETAYVKWSTKLINKAND